MTHAAMHRIHLRWGLPRNLDGMHGDVGMHRPNAQWTMTPRRGGCSKKTSPKYLRKETRSQIVSAHQPRRPTFWKNKPLRRTGPRPSLLSLRLPPNLVLVCLHPRPVVFGRCLPKMTVPLLVRPSTRTGEMHTFTVVRMQRLKPNTLRLWTRYHPHPCGAFLF